MKNKINLFIAGSRGFVGKNLINLIDTDKYNILKPNKIELNLTNYNETKVYLNKNKPDIIINLVSRTKPKINSIKEYDKQIFNTLKPIENVALAANNNVKLIISVGSIEEYGSCKTPFEENMLPQPNSSYGLAKVNSYFNFKMICNTKKTRNVWLRPSLMFGEKMKSERFLSSVINSYKFNSKLIISNPKSKRDYLYVYDFCRIILEIINKYKNFSNETLNVTDENWYSNNILISKIEKIFGKNSNILFSENQINEKMINLLNSKKRFQLTFPNFEFTNFNKALINTFNSYKFEI